MFTKTLIFKVNFEKACDSVSWSFLDFMIGGALVYFYENLFVLVNMGDESRDQYKKRLKQHSYIIEISH